MGEFTSYPRDVLDASIQVSLQCLSLLLGGSRPSPKLSRHPEGSGGYGERVGWTIRDHWESWRSLLVQLGKSLRAVCRGRAGSPPICCPLANEGHSPFIGVHMKAESGYGGQKWGCELGNSLESLHGGVG